MQLVGFMGPRAAFYVRPMVQAVLHGRDQSVARTSLCSSPHAFSSRFPRLPEEVQDDIRQLREMPTEPVKDWDGTLEEELVETEQLPVCGHLQHAM